VREKKKLTKGYVICFVQYDVKEKYRKINKQVKKEVKRPKTANLENNIKRLEDDFRKNNSHNFFKTVRELEKKHRKNIPALKGSDGKKTTNPSEVLKIWKEHFKVHLNTEFPRNEQALDLINIGPHIQHEDEQFTISKEDIKKP